MLVNIADLVQLNRSVLFLSFPFVSLTVLHLYPNVITIVYKKIDCNPPIYQSNINVCIVPNIQQEIKKKKERKSNINQNVKNGIVQYMNMGKIYYLCISIYLYIQYKGISIKISLKKKSAIIYYMEEKDGKRDMELF